MASTTSWDETVPSGTSSIAQGDDDIRSLKSFMRSWISQEHYTTDGSTTSAGEHKLGSARAFSLPLSQISGVANRRGQISHDTTNNYLWVGSGSSISQILGLNEASRNTFTAQQNFHANAKIGTGGSAISSVGQYTLAIASITTIAASSTSVIAISNTLNSGHSLGPFALGYQGNGASMSVQATAYYDIQGEVLYAAFYNPTGSAVTLPAQTLRVSVIQFA
jgi:hypothetical protein